MQQNQKNVEDMPTVELKAAAFDITKQLQFLQGQLSVIEQELLRRAQANQQQESISIPPPQVAPADLPTPPNGLPTVPPPEGGHPPTA